MSSLSTVEVRLPPGFRFHPRDDELICDYLMKWITGYPHQFPLLIEVDLNKCEPWDIPESACVGGKEWYFYSQRDRKYATGLRTNRATVSGYWKATGKDRPITRKGTLVGMRKTLVFYQGRAPKGKKTEWVMHEFRLEGTIGPGPKIASSVKEDWVLCRVFYKSRSEVPAKQDTRIGYEAYSPILSLPPLMEPYNNITFDHHQTQHVHHDQYEQVPCFSIFSTNQTSPTCSPILPTKTTMPNFGGTTTLPQDLGINYNYSMSTSLVNDSDNKVIKAVLNQLAKMETSANAIDQSSPSFGEASPDSYLSSIWNQ